MQKSPKPLVFLGVSLILLLAQISSFSAGVIEPPPATNTPAPPPPTSTPVPPPPSNTPLPPPPTATTAPQQQQQTPPSATPKPKAASPTNAAANPTAAQSVTPATTTCIPDATGTNCPTPTPLEEPLMESGYSVTIHIARSDNQSMANKEVIIDGETYMTDQDSNITIENMDIGDHQVKALVNNKEQTLSFVLGTSDIDKGVTVVLQADSVNYLYWILGVLLLIILAILVFIYLKKKKIKEKGKNPKPDSDDKKPDKPEKS